MKGTDKSTELWRHPIKEKMLTLLSSLILVGYGVLVVACSICLTGGPLGLTKLECFEKANPASKANRRQNIIFRTQG